MQAVASKAIKMKRRKDKKLEWAKPSLESLGNSKVTGGMCGTGSSPDGSTSCTHGIIAANICSNGSDVATAP